MAQILSANVANGETLDDKQYLLDLWLGERISGIQCCTLSWDQTTSPSSRIIWKQISQSSEIEFPGTRPEFEYQPLGTNSSVRSFSTSTTCKMFRFFGWSQIADKVEAIHEAQTGYKRTSIDIYYVESSKPLLDQCSQDVFSTTISALIEQLVVNGDFSLNIKDLITVSASTPTDWHSSTLSDLVLCFKETKMGSHQDALIYILPVLHRNLALPKILDKATDRFRVIRAANKYRKEHQWSRSWRILRDLQLRDADVSQEQEYSTTALSELFCACLGSDIDRDRKFGFSGLKWLQSWWLEAEEKIQVTLAYHTRDLYEWMILNASVIDTAFLATAF